MRSSVAAWVLLLTVGAAAGPSAAPWRPQDFPSPKADFKACNRQGPSSVCDPDHLLSPKASDRIEGVLLDVAAGTHPYALRECGTQGLEGFQVAVAVMRGMEVPASETPASQAEAFAKALHQRWGVGNKACNNGVLLLLSVHDRQVRPAAWMAGTLPSELAGQGATKASVLPQPASRCAAPLLLCRSTPPPGPARQRTWATMSWRQSLPPCGPSCARATTTAR